MANESSTDPQGFLLTQSKLRSSSPTLHTPSTQHLIKRIAIPIMTITIMAVVKLLPRLTVLIVVMALIGKYKPPPPPPPSSSFQNT